MKNWKVIFLSCISLIVFACAACEKQGEEVLRETIDAPNYLTENVVIVVMDGPRFTETWGDPMHKYIPHLAQDLAPKGIINDNFRNVGPTLTTSGHTAITTGHYQTINNSGGQAPAYPSIFQIYRADRGVPANKTWIVTSKDKLEQLSYTTAQGWKNQYIPATDCGNNGLGTGYRDDATTFAKALEVLKTERPNLLLVNFKQPDAAGHANDWGGYLEGIRNTDHYAWEIWRFLQEDEHYQGNTTFFFTNDHGRHLDNHLNGFVSHGDYCDGCQHINFFASGPDFKENIVVSNNRTLIDINATMSELLHLPTYGKYGNVMDELFK